MSLPGAAAFLLTHEHTDPRRALAERVCSDPRRVFAQAWGCRSPPRVFLNVGMPIPAARLLTRGYADPRRVIAKAWFLPTIAVRLLSVFVAIPAACLLKREDADARRVFS